MPLIIVIPVIALLFVSVAAAKLIPRSFPNKKLEAFAALAGVVGLVLTAFSAFWGAYTYYQSDQLQKRLAASSIYQDHMKISMDPTNKDLLGTGKYARTGPPADNSPDDLKNEYERYQWYVGHSLFSFESILEADPDDGAWKNTMWAFIDDHKVYIGSAHFSCEHHAQNVKQLIKQVLAASSLSNPRCDK
jgi:hypothetical protein